MSSSATSKKDYPNRSVSLKMKNLYLDSETADVLFVFKHEFPHEVVPAHKTLLAVGSDVFRAMLYGQLKEGGEITIVDTYAAAFKEFLQFFYLSRVNLTLENICDVMNLGEKYNVAMCQLIGERFLKDVLTAENVCLVYRLAILYDFEELQKLCEVNFCSNSVNIFQLQSFLQCSSNVLRHILMLNILTCSEVEIFEACMNWLKTATNKNDITRELCQRYLGDIFYSIRFGSMKIEEFAALSSKYGHLFSFDEYQEIIQMIVSKDYPSTFFQNQPRQVQWDSGAVVVCSRTIDDYKDNQTIYIFNVDKTTFSTNTLLLLGELVLYPFFIPTKITVAEISTEGHSNTLCIEEITSINTECVSFILPTIALKKPLLIKPGFEYQIHFDRKFSSSKGRKLRNTVEIDTDIIIQFAGSAGPIITLNFNKIQSVSKRNDNSNNVIQQLSNSF